MNKMGWLAAVTMSSALVLGACQGADKDTTPPVLPEMTLENEQTGEEKDPNAPQATYSLEKGDYETFLDEYEEKLTKEGWTVTLDGKPDFLSLEKGDKVLKVMPVELEDGIKVHLYEEEKEQS